MSIQHHSSISNASGTNDHGLTQGYSAIPTSSPHGIAGIPSSIRMLANASGGGICANAYSCIANIFHRIYQLLSQFFGSLSSSSTTRSLLESTISRANQIIDSHFNIAFITHQPNQQNSAIITILKFHGQMEMSCGITSIERSNVDGIKNLMRQLVSRGDINSDGKIEIETILIKKNTDNLTWTYCNKDSWFHSLDSRSGSVLGGFVMDGLPSTLQRLQNRISNDRTAGARIENVIRQLQSSA